MLSGSRDFNLKAILDLTADMSFQMKHSTLLNLKRKSEQDEKSSNDVKNSLEFFKKRGNNKEFENKIKGDLFKVLEQTKTDNPYIERTVQDAETIEKETKKYDFIKTVIKYNEFGTAALEEKYKSTLINYLMTYLVTMFLFLMMG